MPEYIFFYFCFGVKRWWLASKSAMVLFTIYQVLVCTYPYKPLWPSLRCCCCCYFDVPSLLGIHQEVLPSATYRGRRYVSPSPSRYE